MLHKCKRFIYSILLILAVLALYYSFTNSCVKAMFTFPKNLCCLNASNIGNETTLPIVLIKNILLFCLYSSYAVIYCSFVTVSVFFLPLFYYW